MCKVSPMTKCMIFADDANFLYTSVSEIYKTVFKKFHKLRTWFNANKLSLIVANFFYGNK